MPQARRSAEATSRDGIRWDVENLRKRRRAVQAEVPDTSWIRRMY